jgi:hypothetical protein
MLDHVSFDGLVVAGSTRWSKHKTNFTVSGDYAACPEIESQSLAQYKRSETAVHVTVFVSENEKIECDAYIATVATDWIQDKTKVTFSVSGTKKFEGSASVLGTWDEKEVPVTVTIEPLQKALV